MRTIFDTDAYVMSYLESSSNEGLENYWTTDEDGDLYLWGFYRSVEDWGYVFQPAIKRIDAPLYVGKTWSTTVNLYELPEMHYHSTHTYVMTCFEEGIVVVPAGAFAAAGIAPGPYNTLRSGYTLAGQRATESPGKDPADLSDLECFSLSVGRVQYNTDDLYQLTSYDGSTPIVETSWGRIKGLYRSMADR